MRRLVPAAAGLLGFFAALPFFLPYETILPPLLAPYLARAGLEVDWGEVRFGFPRSLDLRNVALRGDFGGRPFETYVDRAVVTPWLSSLWGSPGAHVEVEIAGGTVSIDLEAGATRALRGSARDLDLRRLPVGILLPWDVRGRAGGRGSVRWPGTVVDAAGSLEWEATAVEFRGVRWLGAAWPPIQADRASGKLEISERRLSTDVTSTGGNCPAEAAGSISVLERFGSSPVDLEMRIRPAPEVVTALGPPGEALGRVRTADGVVALKVSGPLESTQTQLR